MPRVDRSPSTSRVRTEFLEDEVRSSVPWVGRIDPSLPHDTLFNRRQTRPTQARSPETRIGAYMVAHRWQHIPRCDDVPILKILRPSRSPL